MNPSVPEAGQLERRESIITLPPSYESLQPDHHNGEPPPPLQPASQASPIPASVPPQVSTRVVPATVRAPVTQDDIPQPPPIGPVGAQVVANDESWSQHTEQDGAGGSGARFVVRSRRRDIETAHILPVLPPLVPVRRVAENPTRHNIPAPPPTRAVEPRDHRSADTMMQNISRAAAGLSGHGQRPTLVEQAFYFEIFRPRPTTNITYTFSPVGPASMLLLPPAEEQDARPRYYITVFQNCFMPLSHITTIYRGSNDSAPRVGEFEMGILASPSHRQIGNRDPELLVDVLKKKGPESKNGTWTWTRTAGSVPQKLYWYCNVMPFLCSTQPPQSLDIAANTVAWFTPRHTKIRYQAPTTLCHLQVTPQGDMLFDDIVMSILAIERKSLTPRIVEETSLFN